MTSLLVTNDFPPKVGGIQSYLHELWRRLPPGSTSVLTTPYPGAPEWDAGQPFRVVRSRSKVLLPTPGMARTIEAEADRVGADVVFLDPLLPLGAVARRLGPRPRLLVLHGAEVTVPGRLPVGRAIVRRVLREVDGVVAAGHYPAREAVRALGRPLPGVIVPPGVDVGRFRPVADDAERAARRRDLGLDPDRPLVVGVSRLVPRKGFDLLIDAVAGLDPSVQLALAGSGRDRARLERRVGDRGIGARVRFLGRVPDDALPDLYRAADVFSMVCRDRWGGLEAEGFGIVFLEAAASGVPSVAGRSGGSHEAVDDGATGHVVDPRSVSEIRAALDGLLGDDGRRLGMGRAARRFAEGFSYDTLVERLRPLAAGDLSTLRTLGADGRADTPPEPYR